MATSILFNTCQLAPNGKYTTLLHLIALHPAFKTAVNQYYQILGSAPTAESITKLGTYYFALLLPDFPLKHLRLLAQ
jgi:hypothetical protein